MLLTLNQFREYFLTSPHSVADRWPVTHFCMTYSLSFYQFSNLTITASDVLL